jgi:hypothetical protein
MRQLWKQINANLQAHTKQYDFDGSRRREGIAVAHQCSQSNPQPFGDFCPKLFYLIGDIISALYCPPHLALGVRRCSAIALRLGGALVL